MLYKITQQKVSETSLFTHYLNRAICRFSNLIRDTTTPNTPIFILSEFFHAVRRNKEHISWRQPGFSLGQSTESESEAVFVISFNSHFSQTKRRRFSTNFFRESRISRHTIDGNFDKSRIKDAIKNSGTRNDKK